jgi:hypothetical protein
MSWRARSREAAVSPRFLQGPDPPWPAELLRWRSRAWFPAVPRANAHTRLAGRSVLRRSASAPGDQPLRRGLHRRPDPIDHRPPDARSRGAYVRPNDTFARSAVGRLKPSRRTPVESAQQNHSGDTTPKSLKCRVSTVVVQRFCKPKVGGSNPSPGTMISRHIVAF